MHLHKISRAHFLKTEVLPSIEKLTEIKMFDVLIRRRIAIYENTMQAKLFQRNKLKIRTIKRPLQSDSLFKTKIQYVWCIRLCWFHLLSIQNDCLSLIEALSLNNYSTRAFYSKRYQDVNPSHHCRILQINQEIYTGS